MMPLSTSFQTTPWFSITRGSDRNSRRYRRTDAGSQPSGVPRLTSSTPILCADGTAETLVTGAAAEAMGAASFMRGAYAIGWRGATLVPGALVPPNSASQTRANALMEPEPFQTPAFGTVPGQARDKCRGTGSALTRRPAALISSALPMGAP